MSATTSINKFDSKQKITVINLVRGQTAADADSHLLDVARRVESYGIRNHPAIDPDHTEIGLAVTHTGVVVMRVSRLVVSLDDLV